VQSNVVITEHGAWRSAACSPKNFVHAPYHAELKSSGRCRACVTCIVIAWRSVALLLYSCDVASRNACSAVQKVQTREVCLVYRVRRVAHCVTVSPSPTGTVVGANRVSSGHLMLAVWMVSDTGQGTNCMSCALIRVGSGILRNGNLTECMEDSPLDAGGCWAGLESPSACSGIAGTELDSRGSGRVQSRVLANTAVHLGVYKTPLIS